MMTPVNRPKNVRAFLALCVLATALMAAGSVGVWLWSGALEAQATRGVEAQ